MEKEVGGRRGEGEKDEGNEEGKRCRREGHREEVRGEKDERGKGIGGCPYHAVVIIFLK